MGPTTNCAVERYRNNKWNGIDNNKFFDLPDGSTIEIVDFGGLKTFLVIPKQESGSHVLYVKPSYLLGGFISKSKYE